MAAEMSGDGPALEKGGGLNGALRSPWPRTFTSLSYRHYRWLWMGSLGSFTAMQMHAVARGWLVYELTSSPLWLGIIGAAHGGPMVLLSPLGGVITDRVAKRNLLLLTQGLAALITLVVAVIIALDAIRVWHLAVYAAFLGAIFAFNMPGRQALVSELVEEEDLMNAISLNSVAQNMTRIAAPALAGVLVAALGVAVVYFIIVGCYVFSVFSLAHIPPSKKRAPDPKAALQEDLKEGINYVWGRPVILALLVLALAPMILGQPYIQLLPVFARELGRGAVGLGILMTATGLGALLGALALASLGDFRRKGLVLLGLLSLFALALMAFANAPSFYLAIFCLLFVGIGSTGYMAVNNTLIQSHVEHEFRGRVLSIYMITFGLMPLGALPSGALAQALGVSITFTLSGGFLLLLALATALLVPRVRRLA